MIKVHCLEFMLEENVPEHFCSLLIHFIAAVLSVLLNKKLSLGGDLQPPFSEAAQTGSAVHVHFQLVSWIYSFKKLMGSHYVLKDFRQVRYDL